MNHKTIQIILIIAIVILGGYTITKNFLNTSQNTEREVAISQEAVSQNAKRVENETSLEENYQIKTIIPYSRESQAAALENGKKVVLFFHAGWCPYCIEAEKDINENPQKIPEEVTILKIDYDTQSELKKKYHITTQDTFIQINQNEEIVAQWVSGGRGVVGLLQYIQ